MALATMFVTLPFVVRELIPVLETMDLSEVRAPLGRGRRVPGGLLLGAASCTHAVSCRLHASSGLLGGAPPMKLGRPTCSASLVGMRGAFCEGLLAL